MSRIEEPNHLKKLLEFLDQLEVLKIFYCLERNRTDAIMVRVDIPNEHWEVEFFGDGEIQVEIFRTTGDGVLGNSEAELAIARLLKVVAN
jgi:hypothetical protein